MRLVFILITAVSLLCAQGGGGRGSGGPVPNSYFPKLIQRVDPEYTEEALAAKLEGSVALAGMIGTDGIPKDISVVKGLGKGLDEKAVECFQKWRFQPGIRNGEPIEVRTQVLITFKLPAK